MLVQQTVPRPGRGGFTIRFNLKLGTARRPHRRAAAPGRAPGRERLPLGGVDDSWPGPLLGVRVRGAGSRHRDLRRPSRTQMTQSKTEPPLAPARRRGTTQLKRPSGWQWRSAHSGGARRTQARAAVRATDGARRGLQPEPESDSESVNMTRSLGLVTVLDDDVDSD